MIRYSALNPNPGMVSQPNGADRNPLCRPGCRWLVSNVVSQPQTLSSGKIRLSRHIHICQHVPCSPVILAIMPVCGHRGSQAVAATYTSRLSSGGVVPAGCRSVLAGASYWSRGPSSGLGSVAHTLHGILGMGIGARILDQVPGVLCLIRRSIMSFRARMRCIKNNNSG